MYSPQEMTETLTVWNIPAVVNGIIMRWVGKPYQNMPNILTGPFKVAEADTCTQ